MPRVNKVEKARNEHKCGKCGCTIEVGQPYVWWKFRHGNKSVRCSKNNCYPNPSELTQSEFWSQVYALQEKGIDGMTIEDLESAKDELVSELEGIKSECEDKLSNMPDGLQQGDIGQMLESRIEALDECISELEGVDISMDEEEPDEDASDEAKEKYNEQLDTKCEEIRDELQAALENISCD